VTAPAAPVDVVRVTGGQDHGARFGLRGSSATIGRGPAMDIVLTDPRVAHLHARLRVDGARLMLEDLSPQGATLVNGVALEGPTALAPGDRLTLAGTELTVMWTPAGALEPPAPGPPPAARRPAPAPASPVPAPPAPAPATVAQPPPGPERVLPALCLALSALAVLALGLPALSGPRGTESLWGLEPAGLRAQALVAALIAALAAGAWLRAARAGVAVLPVTALAGLTAIAGGLVAGGPAFLIAVDLPGTRAEPGLAVLVLTGAAIAALASYGLALELRETGAGPPEPSGVLVLAGGGALGSLLAVAAAPLGWISSGGVELGGLSGGLAAGTWLIPLAFGVATGCIATAAAAQLGHARRATALAVATAALAAAVCAFAVAAAIGLRGYRMEAGLSLVLAGTAMAFVSTAIGAAALTLGAGAGPDDEAGRPPVR
jgi:hypothetical protein